MTMSHRNRLVLLASDSPPPQNATIHILSGGGSPKDPVGKGVPYHLADVNRAMMNVSFVDHPIQCDEPTCQTLAKMFAFGNFMDEAQSSEFKYVIDVSLRPNQHEKSCLIFRRWMETDGLVDSKG